MSFAKVELGIENWGFAKGILPNGKPFKQAMKTLEEASELVEALEANNKEQIIDAIGDVGVTLLMQCQLQGVSFVECLNHSLGVISKRKGTTTADGVFVKE